MCPPIKCINALRHPPHALAQRALALPPWPQSMPSCSPLHRNSCVYLAIRLYAIPYAIATDPPPPSPPTAAAAATSTSAASAAADTARRIAPNRRSARSQRRSHRRGCTRRRRRWWRRGRVSPRRILGHRPTPPVLEHLPDLTCQEVEVAHDHHQLFLRALDLTPPSRNLTSQLPHEFRRCPTRGPLAVSPCPGLSHLIAHHVFRLLVEPGQSLKLVA